MMIIKALNHVWRLRMDLLIHLKITFGTHQEQLLVIFTIHLLLVNGQYEQNKYECK